MLTSNDTHELARTQFVQIGDVRFAYRRFGRYGGLPLLFLNYFAPNMDDWDPKSRRSIVHIVDPGAWHCHVNRKFADQMTMAVTVHAATVAWRHVSIA